MIKFLLTTSLLMFSIISFCATPPAEVLKAYHLKFPTAINVTWGKENAHEFEAWFLLNGLKCATIYTDKGEWIQTETPLIFSKLPKEVQISFSKDHKNSNPKLVSKLVQAKGIIKYEIETKKGINTLEFFYTSNGMETTEK